MGDTLSEILQQGISYHQSGRLDEAIRCYREVLGNQPENTSVLCNIGVALRARGLTGEAVASFRKVLDIDPDNADAHFNLGNALKEQGEPDQAIASYRQAISLKPDCARFHFNLGNTLKLQGIADQAIASYRKAISIEPNDARAHYNLGKTLNDLGRLDDAVASYRQAIACEPGFAEAYQNLGNTLKRQGKLDQTVENYRSLLSLRPDSAVAHYNLGIALRDFGKRDEAIGSMEKALEINPDFAEARHLIDSMLGHASPSAPRRYIERLFSKHADDFENQLVKRLGYRMPSVLRKVVADQGRARNSFGNMVDLGCGTGLVGVAFRDLTERMVGIDLSENMVREAEKKEIYDELHVNDLVDGLDALESKFDLFVSADVLPYIGDLAPLFECVGKYSDIDSLFICSTEHTEADSYVLQETGRYAHSKDYVLSVATAAGFTLDYFTRTKLRKEKYAWITGGVYVLRACHPGSG